MSKQLQIILEVGKTIALYPNTAIYVNDPGMVAKVKQFYPNAKVEVLKLPEDLTGFHHGESMIIMPGNRNGMSVSAQLLADGLSVDDEARIYLDELPMYLKARGVKSFPSLPMYPLFWGEYQTGGK